MRYVTATTEQGKVVRRISSHGEDAWRRNHDGSVDHCLDHKGPWFRATGDVPDDVLQRFEDEPAAAPGPTSGR